MGIAIAGKTVKDGDKIAIQGKKPAGISIQGKVVYVKEEPPPPPPPPVLTSLVPTTGYRVPAVQCYGSGFTSTCKGYTQSYGLDPWPANTTFVSDTQITFNSAFQGMVLYDVWVRDEYGQDSNKLTFQGQGP